jgi:DNA-binding transcriptional LysR family regulator
MDWEALASLAAIQEAGSVTGAAARRHLSQPALTRQVQRLARETGLGLLERRGRGVALTPAGEALAAWARRQAQDWQATLAALRGRQPSPLRVGCGATLALTLLPGALARLRADLPQISVRVLAGDSAATAARVLAGEADAGLVTTAAADPRLLSLPLYRDPVVAVGPPGSPPRLSLSELAARPLCLYARGTGFRAFVDELLAAAGLFPEPVAEVESLEALRELAAAGLGFTLLPASVAAAGRAPRVQVPELAGHARTVALLRRADRPPHPAFAAFHAACAAEGGP